MFQRLAFWKSKGMNPTVVYDIGANDGTWTRQMKTVFPTARYEEFEANSHHARANLHIVLLGDRQTNVSFYKEAVPSDIANTGASIYIETTKHYTPGTYIAETLPMIPLDTYISQRSLPLPDLLKLDVQGAELDVLKGAETILKTTKYVVMEVSLHRWNKGAPMIEEMIAYMSSRGFELIDVIDTHFAQNYLIQIDVVFAHESTGLRKQDFYN